MRIIRFLARRRLNIIDYLTLAFAMALPGITWWMIVVIFVGVVLSIMAEEIAGEPA